jgi:type I restriction enzyme S subunit
MVSSNLVDWQKVTFEDAFTDITAKATKVDQSEFLHSGKFPIVDQGQNFIAGYTDNEEIVWGDDLPVVIFGDHTRILKYVDFPFVLGADGTKVLKPNKDILPLFAYYQLLSFDIPSAGYSRHFKFLKDFSFQYPPLTEQKRIASLLARADRLRHLRRTAHDLGESLLQSVFLEMFGDLSANPKGWDISTLEDLETDFIYGTSQKCFSKPKGYPVLRIPNVLHSKIDLDDLKYAEVPEKEAKNILLKNGDIIFVRTNGNPDYVGRCAVFNLEKDFLFASYLIRARIDLSKINPVFLLAFLQTAKGREAMAPYIRTTAGQSNIGIEGLGQIPVPLPPLSLQEEFAGVVARVESLRGRMSEGERQVENLFESLLAQSFGTG